MRPQPPLLIVPIKALVSADGLLIEADAQLLRLQLLAGGVEGGPLAVPALANLVQLSLKTRMKFERSVRVADEGHDIELWVQTAPDANGVALNILGWHDSRRPNMPADNFAPQPEDSVDEGQQGRLLLSPDFHIVEATHAMRGLGFAAGIGTHIAQLFRLNDAGEGDLRLLELLAARQALHGLELATIEDGREFLADLQPIFAANGAFAGYECLLRSADTKLGVGDIEPDTVAIEPINADFAQDIAPILRQPLSRIIANAETIGSRLAGPLREHYAVYAHDIANAARHLSELVSDMEDLEAIDRSDFVVAKDKIELGDLVRRVTGLLALKAADQHIHLITPNENEKIEAVGEFRRALQILLNLVGNAVRYAPNGSKVTIEIAQYDGMASVSVRDEGEGIAEEDRERVFEKFERLGRSGDGGSGLGLYISRRLARAMGGELIVENAQPKGARFIFSLPIE